MRKTKSTRLNGIPACPVEEEFDGTAQVARRMLAIRRLRDRLLGEQFFSDPAWDILLDLYAQTRNGRRVSVSQISLASGAPATTALRWINTMTEAGLLVREADPTDGRRVFISLSRDGEESMRLFLVSVVSELDIPADECRGKAARPKARKPAEAKSLRSRCATSPSSSTPSSTRARETAS